jgi:hypothetical protein
MMKLLTFVSLALVLCSCDIQMFVAKSRVIHDQNGFLYYNRNMCLFIPDENYDKDFFSEVNGKMAYRIYSGCGIEALRAVANKYYVSMPDWDGKNMIQFDDSIYVVAANIRYLPLKFNKVMIDTGRVTLVYNKTQYSFFGKSLFYGEVLSINSRVYSQSGKD